MAEYIDRERLLRDIDKFVSHHWSTIADVKRIIKEAPALDLTLPRRCVNCGLVCPYGPLVDYCAP